MTVKITKTQENTVWFSSEYGMGKGFCKDEFMQAGQEYLVEFEIGDTLTTNGIIVSEEEKCKSEIVGNVTELTMKLIDYEDDGCASFAFGDSVVLIETKYDERFLQLIDRYLTFKTEKIYLYPFEV